MKKIIVALSVMVAACAPNPGPITADFLMVEPGLTCEIPRADDSSLRLIRGFLDVAGSTAFIAGISLTSSVTSLPVVVSQTTIEKANREQVVLEEMVLNYTTTPKRGAAFKEERIKLGGVFPTTANFVANIIGPLAAANIVDNAVVDASSITDVAPDRVTLTVSVEFRGHLSGSNQAFTTGKYFLPIELVRSACAPRVTLETAVCGNLGQNQRVTCQ